MLKRSKKPFAWILSVMMLLVFIPCFSFADDENYYDEDEKVEEYEEDGTAETPFSLDRDYNNYNEYAYCDYYACVDDKNNKNLIGSKEVYFEFVPNAKDGVSKYHIWATSNIKLINLESVGDNKLSIYNTDFWTDTDSDYCGDGFASVPALGNSYIIKATFSRTIKASDEISIRLMSRVDISKNTTVKFGSAVYSGKAKKPSTKVVISNIKNRSYTLEKGWDYKVAFSNNTKVGKAKAVITGMNNFCGTKTAYFKVVPKKPVIYSITPGKSKLTVKMKTKVSSTGGTTYKIAYKQKGTSKWKTTTTTAQSKTISKLKKGKVYFVKVCAYKKISGTTYQGSYSTTNTSKKVK